MEGVIKGMDKRMKSVCDNRAEIHATLRHHLEKRHLNESMLAEIRKHRIKPIDSNIKIPIFKSFF